MLEFHRVEWRNDQPGDASVVAMSAAAALRRDEDAPASGLSSLGDDPASGPFAAGAEIVYLVFGALRAGPAGFLLKDAPREQHSSPPSAAATGGPFWQLLAVVAGTVLIVAALTSIPARLGARRPVAEILQSEHA